MSPSATLGTGRLQLACAVVGMCLVSPLQYSWTLFAGPLGQQHGWSLASVQLGFMAFVSAQTLVQLPVGAFADRYGTVPIYPVAALLVAIGWGGIGLVGDLGAFYLLYAIAGLGAGAIYCASVGMAARTGAKRRGLAVGLTVAGYAAGTAPFFPAIDRLLEGWGLPSALVFLATVAAGGLLSIGLVLHVSKQGRRPREARQRTVESGRHSGRPAPRQLSPGQLLRTGQFWLMYAILAAVGTGGVALVANFKAFADSNGLSTRLILISLMIQQGANGLGQVTWGWTSDRYDRARVMTVAFAANSFALFLLPVLGGTAIGLVLVAPAVILTWGQAFTLLPALLVDRFGTEHAAGNQGLLYSAKAVASLVGGAVIAWLGTTYGWGSAFMLAGVLAAMAAAGAYALRGMTAGASDASSLESGGQVRPEA